LAQPVVVENRPGASGNIATEAVVRAPADGYKLLAAASPNSINAALYENLTFDFVRDIVPIASVVTLPDVMVVNPAFPARTVAEFIANAKANPGKLNMASPGNATSGHVAGELFKMMAGVDLLHVPYRGGPPAVADLLAGRVQVLFDVVTNSIGLIRTGMLRALAVTTTERSEALPEIPSVAEFVPGYEASFWGGLVAPKGTPAEIVEKLSREIAAALSDQIIKARAIDLGGAPLVSSGADFGKFIAADIVKWAKVIKVAGIKPE
jgi:tripartite-type tricarboxylate transporter receptor subunit TctC